MNKSKSFHEDRGVDGIDVERKVIFKESLPENSAEKKSMMLDEDRFEKEKIFTIIIYAQNASSRRSYWEMYCRIKAEKNCQVHIVYIRSLSALLKRAEDIKKGVELFFCDTEITKEEYLGVMSIIMRENTCAGVLINVAEAGNYLWRYFENRKVVERKEFKKQGQESLHSELAELLVNLEKRPL